MYVTEFFSTALMRLTFGKKLGESVRPVLNLVLMFLTIILMCLGARGN